MRKIAIRGIPTARRQRGIWFFLNDSQKQIPSDKVGIFDRFARERTFSVTR
jgi:hypothetical protein